MKARLYEKYKSEVMPALKEKRKYTNIHQIPKMEKIVVNMGVSASLEKGAIEDAAKDLALITGRKPAISKSRHSIANFKLRENQPIGCRVTLRRDAFRDCGWWCGSSTESEWSESSLSAADCVSSAEKSLRIASPS